MKIFKPVLVATATLLLAASTQADENIYIVGAVAFRGQTYNGIRNLYGANLVSQNPTSGAAATQVTWTGQITNLFGNQTVNIYANYNGAVAGIQELTAGSTAAFLASATNGVTNLITATPNFAFSSVYQASTAYTTPVLNDVIFGATPVLWVKSVGAPANFTNITGQQVQELAANGSLAGSYFTGNTNDTNQIYFITRDTSAGQRVIAFHDAGFNGSPLAYFNNGTSWVVDTTGRTSSTVIDTQLNSFGPAVSYLTGVDAITVTNGTVISYNGVYPFTGSSLSSVSNNYAPLINGQYSLWGYEHILTPASPPVFVTTFLTALQSQLTIALSAYPYTVPVSALKVGRNTDGGPVFPQ